MSSFERSTIYFKSAGEPNTDTLLKAVKEYTEKESIRDIVVASTTGKTGAKFAKTFRDLNVVVVTHNFSFQKPRETELQEEHKQEILAVGAKIFTGVHALSSVERAVRKDFGTIQPLELMANVLRGLGEGTKVCVEITMMAADAGLIPVNRDIIAIAGTGRGADTALVMRPANAARFIEIKIKEIIGKPSEF